MGLPKAGGRTSVGNLTMEALYVCLLLLFTSGLAVPITERQSLISIAEASREQERRRNNVEIVGNRTADIKKYPYTVSNIWIPPESNNRVLLGGGAILNKHWILCSAMQLAHLGYSGIRVRVGSNDIWSGGQELNLSKEIIHEKFDGDYPYNVALLKTLTPIKLSQNVKPIKLAKAIPKAGSKAVITGYGSPTGDLRDSGNLQMATVGVVNRSECQEAHPDCQDTCFCADADDVGPCLDDMGDPLVRNNELIGWFLGGDYCNYFGLIDLYSDVTSFRQWIFQKIKQNSNEEEMEGIDDVDDFH